MGARMIEVATAVQMDESDAWRTSTARRRARFCLFTFVALFATGCDPNPLDYPRFAISSPTLIDLAVFDDLHMVCFKLDPVSRTRAAGRKPVGIGSPVASILKACAKSDLRISQRARTGAH